MGPSLHPLALPLALLMGAASALLPCARLAALEVPTGILALPEPKADEAPRRRINCGGAAVLISADGLALSLEEALPEARSAGERRCEVVLAGGVRRQARVLKQGAVTGAVLLRVDLDGATAAPVALADSSRASVGDAVWSAGNSFGVLEQDGVAALSRGIVSGIYAIPSDSPAVRGRGGRVLSAYRGTVIETDAAINDGNQGGALLDDAGRLLGLVSLGLARERRLGTVVPIHLILADLGAEALPGMTTVAPAGQRDPVAAALGRHAAALASSIALVYLERPDGLGNPKGAPRPMPISDDTPMYERERLERDWDRYYHQQQVFYTDQPVTALVIDAQEGLMISAGSNLHGGARRGRVLLEGAPIDCELVAWDETLDIVLFKAARPLPLASATLAAEPRLACGDAVAIVGRHRPGSGHTLTTGVVSAVDRRRVQSEHAFHQTDALANYGNLGGPVMDAAGEVVGLVCMLGPDEDWLINSGVTLFVDSGTIAKILPGLRQGQSQKPSRRVGLGVALEYEPAGKQVVIREVLTGTGAEAAGVKAGDRLLRVAGQEVATPGDLSRIIIRHRLGDRLELAVLRDGAELALSVELRAFDSSD